MLQHAGYSRRFLADEIYVRAAEESPSTLSRALPRLPFRASPARVFVAVTRVGARLVAREAT